MAAGDTATTAEKGPGATAPGPSGRLPSLSGGSIVGYLLLIAFDGLALWGIIRMIELQSWLPLAITVAGAALVNFVYWSRERFPGKYLVPMAIILTVFAVIPGVYNVYISFTNSGTGNLITKEQAVDRLETQTLPAGDDARVFRVDVVRDGDSFSFLFTDQITGDVFVAEDQALADADDDLLVFDGDRIVSYGGEPVLVPHPVSLQLVKQGVQFLLADLVDDMPAIRGHDGGDLRVFLQNLRDKRASLLFQILEGADLVRKPLPRHWAVVNLVNPAVVTDAHLRLFGVFDLSHGNR